MTPAAPDPPARVRGRRRPARCTGRADRPDRGPRRRRAAPVHERRALRRPAQAAPRPGDRRPADDEPEQGHADHGLLLRPRVRPGHGRGEQLQGRRSGLPTRSRRQPPQAGRPAADRLRPAAHQREVGRISPHVLPQGPGWVGDPGPAGRRLARVVPGLGVRHAGDARQHRHGRVPEGLRRRGRGREDRGPDHRGGRPDDLPHRQAPQAPRVLRLSRRRPTRRLP